MQAIRSLSRGAFIAAACSLSLQAQCFDSNTGTTVGTGDDTVLAAQTLPFAFPFNGATFTTIHPVTNGFIYLSNGTTTGGALCCTGTVANLTAATSPMIAPWWTDLNMISGTGSVKVFSSPSKVNITWENAIEFGGSTANGTFSVQLQLYPSGEFDFVYDSRVAVRNAHTFLTGMSPGAGATAGAASIFDIAGVGATNTNYQLSGPTNGPVSLAGKGIHFVPTNPGFVWVPTSCSANHTSYGAGCYSLPSGFYQNFTDAVAAQAGLQGNAMLLNPAGTSYVPVWIPGGAAAFYVAPTAGATSLPTTDDGDTLVTPSVPFPSSAGPVPTFSVSHNAIVTMAATSNNSFDYTPTGPEFAAGAAAAFYSWHDWVDTDTAGTGTIKTEEVGGVLYITWDNVENYPTAVVNPGTIQFQFNLTTGSVTYVWLTIDPSLASTFGTAHLVGYKAAGAIADPGSINLATQLPGSVPNVSLLPLALSASPNPISTPTTGTIVTFTTSNIPEFVPTSGLYIALNIISLGQFPAPGLDLGFLGAPGCAALVQSIDFAQSMVGVSNSQTVTLTIPAGVPGGTMLYAQSAALVSPNSLPNGQNAFGMTTSNGIASFIQAQ